MAWASGFGWVVAQFSAFLAPVQRLDGGIDVQHPGFVQRLARAMHERRSHPRRAGCFIDAFQGTAQRVLADYSVHAQRLRCHRIASQRGDVGVAPMSGQQAQHQGAQHVAFVRSIATAV